jgi:hypothetical protein
MYIWDRLGSAPSNWPFTSSVSADFSSVTTFVCDSTICSSFQQFADTLRCFPRLTLLELRNIAWVHYGDATDNGPPLQLCAVSLYKTSVVKVLQWLLNIGSISGIKTLTFEAEDGYDLTITSEVMNIIGPSLQLLQILDSTSVRPTSMYQN